MPTGPVADSLSHVCWGMGMSWPSSLYSQAAEKAPVKVSENLVELRIVNAETLSGISPDT